MARINVSKDPSGRKIVSFLYGPFLIEKRYPCSREKNANEIAVSSQCEDITTREFGCISCFACKTKGGKSYGKCAVKDGPKSDGGGVELEALSNRPLSLL